MRAHPSANEKGMGYAKVRELTRDPNEPATSFFFFFVLGWAVRGGRRGGG